MSQAEHPSWKHGYDPRPLSEPTARRRVESTNCPQCDAPVVDLEAHIRWHTNVAAATLATERMLEDDS